MLEIKNVKRIYKPKKGVSVTALDDVSLKFAEKGMVFILGKSGSGKSTLLNVMGGLDKYDEGEIIIKGKSSKEFSQGDFDSYRNTYLGFIFQEYNILNEFSVGANIALALELQGKKATDELINEILEEVDLLGYGSRKPSELSGGQKQRVAIARALVKNPEIIMADEPTGALDSNTGLQVFDTLRKLSKDKLVLVVTHDREFAEYYGDRVIELMDGKVISDIEKYKAESHKKNKSVTVIDDKIIQIKKGYKLTAEDLNLINSYVSTEDVIISIDKKTNAGMKKFARIDDDGNKEAFKDTDESNITIADDQKFKLIKSRLPFKDSFKIGASSLKNKPFRLFVTILLSMVAFCMFGLADTMASYNKYTTTRTSIVDSNINSFTLQKTKLFANEKSNYITEVSVNSSDSDILLLKDKLGLDFDKIYLPDKNGYLYFSDALNKTGDSISSYTRTFGGFFEINQQKLNGLGFRYTGILPAQDGEIAISEYAYRHFAKYGYRDDNIVKNAEEITSESGFLALEPKITIRQVEYSVTAIINTDFDYEHFDNLNDQNTNDIVRYILMQELSDTVNYGYHGLVYVPDGFIDNQIQANTSTKLGLDINNGYISISNQTSQSYQNASISSTYMSSGAQRLYSFKDLNNSSYTKYIMDGKTSLAKNEVMIDLNSYINWIENQLNRIIENNYENNDENREQIMKDEAPLWYYNYMNGYKDIDDYVFSYIEQNLRDDFAYYDQLFIDYDYTSENGYNIVDMDIGQKQSLVYDILINYPENSSYGNSYNQLSLEYDGHYGDDIEVYRKSIINKAITSGDIMDSNNLVPRILYMSAYNYTTNFSGEDIIVSLVGIIYNPDDSYYNNIFVVDDALYNNMDIGDDGDYAYLIAKMPTDSSTLTKLIKFSYDYNENNTSYFMKNGVMSTLSSINELIETLAKVFLYIGIGFAVFAAIMLMNYIATSISYKRREIGILRAVGARSSDVFGIFFNESLLIAFINFALASLATFVVVKIINTVLRTEYNLLITILNFGIRQILLMLGISVLVAFVASFLPVYKVARQRPIDAIKQ